MMKATINGITVEGTPQEIEEMKIIIKSMRPGMIIPYDEKIGVTVDDINKAVNINK